MARMTNVVVFISFRARRSSNVVFESGTGIGLIFRNRFAAHAAGRGGVNHRDRFNLDALRASAFRNPKSAIAKSLVGMCDFASPHCQG